MEETTEIMPLSNWKPKALAIGAVLGALVGLGAAYLFIQRAEAENEGNPPPFSLGEGVKLGLLTLGTLRQIAQMGEGNK